MDTRNGRTRRKIGTDPAFPRLLGERLCLNFANTIEDPAGTQPREFLTSYDDLVRWGRHAGTLSDDQTVTLLVESDRQPDEAVAVFARALALRGAIDRVFRALARHTEPHGEDLRLIQSEYVAALEHGSLVACDGRFGWAWSHQSPLELERALWPVTQSAVDLLVDGDPDRIKACPAAEVGCTSLFYDTSKNRSRRWCSMEGCGSQVKMRRYHARHRPPGD